MKKILVHSPYWKTRSGGERYALTVASCLQGQAKVYASVASRQELSDLSAHLGIPLAQVSVLSRWNSWRDLLKFHGIFWVSDGSIPVLPVKRRVIHFQAPFLGVNGRSAANRIKLLGSRVVCNSRYTKNFIDSEYGVDAGVIYPPVEVHQFQPRKKERLILTVGRFLASSTHKRPDVLVDTFKQMVDAGLKDWRLVVVGVAENSDSESMVTELRTKSRGYPVAIRVNLPHQRLIQLFGQATFYWHAAGFGTDLAAHPERAEHFGISTVEAMAAGAVSCSFAAGGQLEIIEDGQSGILWSTPSVLAAKTLDLIHHRELREEIAAVGIKRAQDFGKDRFCQEINKLFI